MRTIQPTTAAYPWNTQDGYNSYSHMAQVVPNGDSVRVQFQNGDDVRVPITRLVQRGTTIAGWSIINANEYDFTIAVGERCIEVPGNRIRLLTDRDYAGYWHAQDSRHVGRIGARLRELRLARGLSGKDTAERAGIAPMSLSRIELGRHDVVAGTLARILAALGASWADHDTDPAVS